MRGFSVEKNLKMTVRLEDTTAKSLYTARNDPVERDQRYRDRREIAGEISTSKLKRMEFCAFNQCRENATQIGRAHV